MDHPTASDSPDLNSQHPEETSEGVSRKMKELGQESERDQILKAGGLG